MRVCLYICVLSGCANPEELTMEVAHSAVEDMFETLRGLSHARDHLKQLRSVYTASDGVHQVRDTQTYHQHQNTHIFCCKAVPSQPTNPKGLFFDPFSNESHTC